MDWHGLTPEQAAVLRELESPRSEVLLVLVVCPKHPEEVLVQWRAFLHDDNTRADLVARGFDPATLTPMVEAFPFANPAEVDAEVFPPSDWEDGRAECIPIGIGGATLADVRDGTQTPVGASTVERGRRETPRHLQVRWRCPRPSCPVDVSLTGDTRLKLRTEVVAELWRAGRRGELRLTPAHLRL